jgi:hypothetical protein
MSAVGTLSKPVDPSDEGAAWDAVAVKGKRAPNPNTKLLVFMD